MIKYIAYAADMPVCLPKAIESKIIHSLENNVAHGMKFCLISKRVKCTRIAKGSDIPKCTTNLYKYIWNQVTFVYV